MANNIYSQLTLENNDLFARTDWTLFNEIQQINKYPVACYLKDFNCNLFIPRAGILPYTDFCGKRYYLFGVDRQSKDLTDFGGRILRSDKSTIEGAFREFGEETSHCFGHLNIADYINSTIVYSETGLIITIKLNIDPRKAPIIFRKSNENNREISTIQVIPANTLHKYLYTPTSSEYNIYYKIKKLLKCLLVQTRKQKIYD